MHLTLQILTLFFSFLFGIFFFLGLELQDVVLKKKKKGIIIIDNFFYVLINTFIYFLLIKKINNAIFHPYAIAMIVIGYIVGYYLLKCLKSKRFHLSKKKTFFYK